MLDNLDKSGFLAEVSSEEQVQYILDVMEELMPWATFSMNGEMLK